MGGGIGIMALMAKEMGVFKDITGDISEYMLEQGRNKALSIRYNSDRIEFRQLDAEALTFKESQERKRYK